MRRLLAIGAGLFAVGVLVGVLGATGGNGGYLVRAVFDNAGFVVPGEEVRIAGAKVGLVRSVDVSMPGEIVSRQGGDHAIPGKAVVVLSIDNPGFTDFRQDASCIVRPQSLIGEKFVECTPTQARAPGQPTPPELARIPDGQPGAGEHLLPLEQNGKAVDLDLVQNIMRRPFADRFRLIINELGAGLAARGPDLAAIVDRADPALRATDRVLAILASQNRELASLASNSDAIFTPLAPQRTHITGFISNANRAGEAVLTRSPALEASLRRLPPTLSELRLTMTSLRRFADQGTPLFTDLNASGRNISRATRKLGPLAESATPALNTLGSAAQTAGPKLVAATPVLADLAQLSQSSTPTASNLASLLDSFSRTNGFRYLMDFIYNSAGSVNGFDTFGHFLRANLQVTSCLDYQIAPQSGCEAFFLHHPVQQKKKRKKHKKKKHKKGRGRAATPAGVSSSAVAAQLNLLLGNGTGGGR